MILSMTAYNRPEYLRATLRSLDLAAYLLPERTYLVVNVDPSDRLAEVVNEFAQLQHVYEVALEVNPERLNLQANTYAANERAFLAASRLREDYVLGLPDDLRLAPDALKLAAYLRDEYRDDFTVPFTSLFSAAGPGRFAVGGEACPPEGYLRTNLSAHFHCQAWGCWASTWEEDWLPLWNHENPISWDQNVNDHVMQGRLQALPWLSRVTHIGRYGTHASADTFEADKPTVFAGDVQGIIPEGEFWHD